jgi:hypothetical protein
LPPKVSLRRSIETGGDTDIGDSQKMEGRSRKSPEPATQAREHFIAGDESHLSTPNLGNAALDFDAQCLLGRF